MTSFWQVSRKMEILAEPATVTISLFPRLTLACLTTSPHRFFLLFGFAANIRLLPDILKITCYTPEPDCLLAIIAIRD